MKKALSFFTVCLTWTMLCILAGQVFSTEVPQTQVVNIGTDVLGNQAHDSLYGWFSQYWEYIALAASEIIALLPVKYNGILHAAVKIGQSLFGKK